MKKGLINAVLGALLSLLLGAQVFAQGTAFTYQGRLNANGLPANGTYDLQFTVFDTSGGAGTVAGPVIGSGVPVANGLFTVSLDFGTGVFTGPARWLQIAVRTNGTATFTNLSPRQALTPTPYAIHAGTASNVVNGAVVKSLNNLRDNVTLAAGANVTLTPSGNTLTIASTGGGSNGLWLLNGGSAYYNGGNVGVGTSVPANKLTVRTPSSDYGVEHTDGNVRLSTYLGGVTGGGWLGTISNHKLNFFANDSSAIVTVDTTGNVGIGTSTPATRLTVLTSLLSYGLEHTDGNVRLSTFLDGTGGWLGTVSNHRLHFYVNDGFPSMTVDTSGNVGIGTLAPAHKLTVCTPSSDYGLEHTDGNVRLSTYVGGTTGGGYLGTISNHKLSFFVNDQAASMTVDTTGNVGIGTTTPADKLYIAGEGASGYAIGIEGNARQNRDKGGWVKAMAYVDNGTIIRSYNPFETTTLSFPGVGHYRLDFGFRVDDRFVSVTAHYGGGDVSAHNMGANFDFTGTTTIDVLTYDANGGEDTSPAAFMIIVY